MQNRLIHWLPPATGSIISLVSGFKYDRYARLSGGYPQTGSTEQLYRSQVAALVCSSKAEPIGLLSDFSLGLILPDCQSLRSVGANTDGGVGGRYPLFRFWHGCFTCYMTFRR